MLKIIVARNVKMEKKSISIIGLAIILSLMTACGDKIEPGTTGKKSPGTVRAAVGTAAIANQPFTYTAVGTVEARTSSTLSGKLMGTIRAITVKEGDRVKKGDVLVVIDDRQVTAGFDQAEAGLAEAQRALQAAKAAREGARADAKLAEATFNRYKRLLAEESASQQEFDEVKARYDKAVNGLNQAKAMVAAAIHRINQAKAGVASARVSKKDVEIKAPYDGTITAKMADVGNLAAPGTPFLTIEGGHGYQVKLILPEVHIETITLDQSLTVKIPSLTGLTLNGTVETISPTADQRTRSFYVKVVLPENKNIRSGMFARVEIPVGQAGIIAIPHTAVIERGQLTGFYLIDKENIAHFRLFRTGRTLGERIEVISGVKEGDRYVVDPGPDMADGVTVEVAS